MTYRAREAEDRLMTALMLLLFTVQGFAERQDDVGGRARACMHAVRCELGAALVDSLLATSAAGPEGRD